jgi:serine/threonine-protein phosphatase 5
MNFNFWNKYLLLLMFAASIRLSSSFPKRSSFASYGRNFIGRFKHPPRSNRTFATNVVGTEFQSLVQSLDDKSFDDMTQDTVENRRKLLEYLMNKFQKNETVDRQYLQKLLQLSIKRLKETKNIVNVDYNKNSNETTGSIIVCGDTHGQYDDFIQIFDDKFAGFPSQTNRFIFNGDIADRGPKAVEIFTLLLTMQLFDEQTVTILRGNHESELTERYGFKRETIRKYDEDMFDLFKELFEVLPLAATVCNQVFVVHGGLGPNTYNLTLEDINAVNRNVEPSDDKIVGDFLWSDPRNEVDTFAFNEGRGGGVYFGEKITKHFLGKNQLSLLVRSHEVVDEGFEINHDQTCITIFSAPNYCGVQRNKAALLKLNVQNVKNEITSQVERIMEASIIQFDSKIPYSPRKKAPEFDL